MKKIYFLRFLKALALLIPITAVVLVLQGTVFFHWDHDTERIRGFYNEPADSLDVMVLGASEVYSGFFPAYAYEYSGLTSYIYAYASNPGALYLSQLREILSRQKPQMIVVEVNGFTQNASHVNSRTSLRCYVENIPFSANKLRTIWEHPIEDKLSCVLPFLKYHGRWTMTRQEMKEQLSHLPSAITEPRSLKGAYTISRLNDIMPDVDVSEDYSLARIDPVAQDYLIQFLDECRELGVENLVFVRFPHKITKEDQYEYFCRANQLGEIINSYGYDFLNMERLWDDIGVDPQYDFYDREHLSVFGQMKVTEYLCDILTETYGISPMPQTEENTARWEESVILTNALYDVTQLRLDEGREEELYENEELLTELREYLSL